MLCVESTGAVLLSSGRRLYSYSIITISTATAKLWAESGKVSLLGSRDIFTSLLETACRF